MDLMKRKLIVDFEKAWDLSSSINLGQLDMEYGVKKLRDHIVHFIHPEIKILDAGTLNVLLKSSTELSEINKKKKHDIRNRTKVDDSIDERNLRLRLIYEDYQRWHQELLLIQELMDRKQWYKTE